MQIYEIAMEIVESWTELVQINPGYMQAFRTLDMDNDFDSMLLASSEDTDSI